MPLQFIDERAPGFFDLRCDRTRHAVYEFSEGDPREGDLDLSKHLLHGRKEAVGTSGRNRRR
jgi:hypothetical protein